MKTLRLPLKISESVLLTLHKTKLAFSFGGSYYIFMSFLSTVLKIEIKMLWVVLKAKHDMEFCLHFNMRERIKFLSETLYFQPISLEEYFICPHNLKENT